MSNSPCVECSWWRRLLCVFGCDKIIDIADENDRCEEDRKRGKGR